MLPSLKKESTMEKPDEASATRCNTDPYWDALGAVSCVGFVAAMSASAGGWDMPGPQQMTRGDCDRLNATEPRFKAVCLRGGTEPPRSGKYDSKRTGAGAFRCACCGAPLFGSAAKFESGTGWPSFHSPYDASAITYAKDAFIHTEVRCSRCDAHLGHVFGDGPKPTGLRYCINSACLALDAGTPSNIAGEGGLPWVCHWALMTALTILACFGVARALWRHWGFSLARAARRRAKTTPSLELAAGL